ncbi:hypothetical protein Tco_1352833 [Tanacetum coccineum]
MRATDCTSKARKRDAAYLQQQLQIAQEEEAGIQSTQVECKFMAAADAYEETERVKMDQLSPARVHWESKSKSNASRITAENLKKNHRNFSIPKTQKLISHRNRPQMNSRADNQSANVSKLENQKKHKANVRKSKELGSQGSLASSRPSKPRNCLRWVPTGRIFAMCGKLTASSNTENKSDKSVCDNASTSNPSKPSSKGFSNSTSLLGRLSRLRKQHTSIYPIVVL